MPPRRVGELMQYYHAAPVLNPRPQRPRPPPARARRRGPRRRL